MTVHRGGDILHFLCCPFFTRLHFIWSLKGPDTRIPLHSAFFYQVIIRAGWGDGVDGTSCQNISVGFNLSSASFYVPEKCCHREQWQAAGTIPLAVLSATLFIDHVANSTSECDFRTSLLGEKMALSLSVSCWMCKGGSWTITFHSYLKTDSVLLSCMSPEPDPCHPLIFAVWSLSNYWLNAKHCYS